MQMSLRSIPSRGALGLALFATTPALAGDPSVVWGTAGGGGAGGSPVVASATYQNIEMKNAQMVTMGKNVTIINNSITSCGSCTYYSITGSDNTIADNNVNSTNFGKTQSEGTINTFFATNILPDPATGASLVREATTSGPPAQFTAAE
jgi:hypothetical protein